MAEYTCTKDLVTNKEYTDPYAGAGSRHRGIPSPFGNGVGVLPPALVRTAKFMVRLILLLSKRVLYGKQPPDGDGALHDILGLSQAVCLPTPGLPLLTRVDTASALGIRTTYSMYSSVSLFSAQARIPERRMVSTA